MESAVVRANQFRFQPAIVWRFICLGGLFGFFIGWGVDLPIQIALAAIILIAILWWRRFLSTLVAVFMLSCLIAWWRGNGLVPEPPSDYLIGKQQFMGKIVDLPRLSERTNRYVVAPLLNNNQLDWRILVTTTIWPEFYYGDTVHFSCLNLAPLLFKPYNYRALWRSCDFPETTLINRDNQSLRYWLYVWRRQAGDKLRSLVSEPYATLATGMMWGDDSGLLTELKIDFRRTGTSHLLAVSGFNVMVLTKVLFWFFIALGLWRRQASLVVLAAIGLFIVFSGGEPSVVRAGIMGSVLLVGQVLSRPPDRFNMLAGTAVAMLFVEPPLLVDLGWQLSFAAMIGLAYLSPFLAAKLQFLPESLGWRQAGAETLAAALATMPVVVARLEEVSLITPLTNLMVAPVPVAVYIFGLSSLLLGMINDWLAAPVIWLLSAVLYYLVTVVDWLADLSWATVPVSWWTVPAMAAVGILLWWWRYDRAGKNRQIR